MIITREIPTATAWRELWGQINQDKLFCYTYTRYRPTNLVYQASGVNYFINSKTDRVNNKKPTGFNWKLNRERIKTTCNHKGHHNKKRSPKTACTCSHLRWTFSSPSKIKRKNSWLLYTYLCKDHDPPANLLTCILPSPEFIWP